jgi:hypothetical protein
MLIRLPSRPRNECQFVNSSRATNAFLFPQTALPNPLVPAHFGLASHSLSGAARDDASRRSSNLGKCCRAPSSAFAPRSLQARGREVWSNRYIITASIPHSLTVSILSRAPRARSTDVTHASRFLEDKQSKLCPSYRSCMDFLPIYLKIKDLVFTW